MLASGTQDRGFAPDRSRRIFPATFLRSGSKIICPNFGACKRTIAGQIPLVPSFASGVRCVSGQYAASCLAREGSSWWRGYSASAHTRLSTDKWSPRPRGPKSNTRTTKYKIRTNEALKKKSWWGRNFSHLSRPALGRTQPQWVPRLFPGVQAAGQWPWPHLASRLKKD
jgi:hypothetical protein